MRFENKVAVVTGGSKGIGAAIARRLAAEGAAVVVNHSSSPEAAARVVADIAGQGGKAIAVQADLSRPSDVVRLFAEMKQAFDKLDILVNNAGVYEFQPLEGITETHVRRLFAVNVLGLVFACREGLGYFGSEGGSIINVSSVAAELAPPSASIYSGTKAAVEAITRSLAKELGPRKIRVNCVRLGPVETEGFQAAGLAGSEFQRQSESRSPLGRIGRPGDVAPAVAFLASDEAAWITGTTLVVSGGL